MTPADPIVIECTDDRKHDMLILEYIGTKSLQYARGWSHCQRSGWFYSKAVELIAEYHGLTEEEAQEVEFDLDITRIPDLSNIGREVTYGLAERMHAEAAE